VDASAASYRERRQVPAKPGSAGREPEPVSGVRLYWARNDGMSGHVFLDPLDVDRLRQEMVLQGMPFPKLRAGMHVTATEVDDALESATPDPISLGDPKLWSDWLAFLEGASVNGGVLVR
jgi:hypothetical protein